MAGGSSSSGKRECKEAESSKSSGSGSSSGSSSNSKSKAPALFTFNSKQLGEDNEGLFGFSLAEVSNHMELGAKRRCKYCHLAGATARCDKKHCGLWMHFPCGQEKGATFQFNGRMMIYCNQHRLRQKVVIIVS